MLPLLRTAIKRFFQSEQRRSPVPKAEETAPDFDVLAHDGSRVKLADLLGKRVLLWFYPKADTPG